MKKIKWHKFGLIAFLIWFINGSINIISGPFRAYFASIMMFLIIIIMSSCSSVHYKQNQAKKKADKMIVNTQRQFAVVNNQIIIFENN